MSNQLSTPSVNVWNKAQLTTPTITNPTFVGTITLPAGSSLKTQQINGFVSTIVSATAAIIMIPILVPGTMTTLAVAANVAATVGPATFTFSRITGGVTTAITNGVVSIATTDAAGTTISATVSQVFVAGDTLKVLVGGTNTAAGTAGITAKLTVA